MSVVSTTTAHGAALQANIINQWRNHFIIEEEMLELDTTIMTLADVLKTSGHVDKFADWMCKDTKNGEIFRADHLVEGVLEARLEGDKQARAKEAGETIAVPAEAAGGRRQEEQEEEGQVVRHQARRRPRRRIHLDPGQIDNFDGKQLGELIRKYDIRSPESGNEVSEPIEFNLMFESSIGPTGQVKGYLRPRRPRVTLSTSSVFSSSTTAASLCQCSDRQVVP